MPNIQAVIDKLHDQDLKLESINKSLGQIEVQANKIEHMQEQLKILWKKHDETLGPEGMIREIGESLVEIKTKQGFCKVGSLDVQVKLIWAALVVSAIGLIKSKLGG